MADAPPLRVLPLRPEGHEQPLAHLPRRLVLQPQANHNHVPRRRGTTPRIPRQQALAERDHTLPRNKKLSKSKGTNGTLLELASQDDIVKNLECPVCYNVPIPPIAYCSGGHIVCGPCRSKLDSCGLCKRRFSSNRNYALEAIINASYFNCRFEGDGCTTKIKGEDYNQHTKNCGFRNITCIESQNQVCYFVSVPFPLYWQHLKDVHMLKTKTVNFNDYAVIDLEIPINATTFTSDKCCLEVLNTDHKFIIRGIHMKGTFKFWASYFGGKEDGLNFKATLTIGDNVNSEISWVMAVSSFRRNMDDLDEFGIVADSYMKKIAQDENGVYKVLLLCKIEDRSQEEVGYDSN